MLRLGKDVALRCEICHKPIAVSRTKARPTVKKCAKCNKQGGCNLVAGQAHDMRVP